MRKLIIYLFFLSGLVPLGVRAGALQLQDKAPSRYVVVPGDTLWGISARFLKDPWKWPQIWGMNREEIENPHLIYPGDVIVLENDGGNPRLRVESPGGEQGANETVRLEPGVRIRDLGRAIPSIPLSAIGPFLSKTRIVSRKTWNGAPKLISGENGNDILGAGYIGYVSGLSGGAVSWSVYGKGRELTDPVSGKSMGLEADYLGEAKLVKPGNPAKIEITRSAKEIEMGAALLPVVEQTVTHFVPHAPDKPIKGRILSSDGKSEIAQNDAVILDLGSRDGVELGNVLAVDRAGTSAMDGGRKIRLPSRRVGLVMIFRVYDTVSYALVVQSERTIHAGDIVRTP